MAFPVFQFSQKVSHQTRTAPHLTVEYCAAGIGEFIAHAYVKVYIICVKTIIRAVAASRPQTSRAIITRVIYTYDAVYAVMIIYVNARAA